ncbi:peptidoglycan bridge formation protein FemAB [Spirochaetia bacterium]|nr:peptidoglycan bridge formation protein FemAB [Spirochaetia bacterium]
MQSPTLTPVDLAQCDIAASFLQSGFWGSFKAKFDWTARGFRVEWPADAGSALSGVTLHLLVMSRPLAPGISFAYVPWGPELPATVTAPGEAAQDTAESAQIRQTAVEAIAWKLRPFLPKNTAFIRFDPPWYYAEDPNTPQAIPIAPSLEKPFTRAAADVQPPDTVIVDITQTEEGILVGMKEKWRYNIRLAGKKGVQVRRADAAELPVFYRLFRETARRDGIAIHSIDYYQTLFAHSREYVPAGQETRLYIASHEGEDLAAIITLFRGQEATYLYGASSDRKRNLMATYLLQWQAMRDAKAAGCLRYDLFGIPPNDNPDHPMAGLYRFKTGFGGMIIHRPGSWDYAYRPMARLLFTAAERLRKKLRDLKK